MAGEMKKVAGVMAAYKVASDLETLKNETEKIKKIHLAQLEEAENLTNEAKRQNEILKEHNEEMQKLEQARLELVQEEKNDANEARSRKELLEYVDRCASKGYGPNYAILVQKFYDAGHLLAFDILIERMAKLPTKFKNSICINEPVEPWSFISSCESRYGFTNFWELLNRAIIQDNCENIVDVAIKRRDQYLKEKEEDHKKVLAFRHLKMDEFINSLIAERERLITEDTKEQSERQRQINSEVASLKEEKLELEKKIEKFLKIKSLKAAQYISYIGIVIVPLAFYFNYMSLGGAVMVMGFQVAYLYKLITLPEIKKKIEQLDQEIKTSLNMIIKIDPNPEPDLTDFIGSKFATRIIEYFDDLVFEDSIVYSDNLMDQVKITQHLFEVFGVDRNELSVKGLNKNQRTDLMKELNGDLNQQIVKCQDSDSRIHKTVVKIWYLYKIKYEF